MPKVTCPHRELRYYHSSIWEGDGIYATCLMCLAHFSPVEVPPGREVVDLDLFMDDDMDDEPMDEEPWFNRP
jgi:hypothetical protein